MTAPPNPPAADTLTPEFTAVRRPGPPLTPVLLEERIESISTTLSTGLALLIIVASWPATVTGVAVTIAIGAAVAVFRLLKMRSATASFGPVFHEPLPDDPREPLRAIVLRQLPIDIGLPLVVLALFALGEADPAAEPINGATAVAWAGVLLGFVVSTPFLPRFVRTEERALGGELLYQRRPWRESVSAGNSPLTSGHVVLVDQRDPSRWGPEPS